MQVASLPRSTPRTVQAPSRQRALDARLGPREDLGERGVLDEGADGAGAALGVGVDRGQDPEAPATFRHPDQAGGAMEEERSSWRGRAGRGRIARGWRSANRLASRRWAGKTRSLTYSANAASSVAARSRRIRR